MKIVLAVLFVVTPLFLTSTAVGQEMPREGATFHLYAEVEGRGYIVEMKVGALQVIGDYDTVRFDQLRHSDAEKGTGEIVAVERFIGVARAVNYRIYALDGRSLPSLRIREVLEVTAQSHGQPMTYPSKEVAVRHGRFWDVMAMGSSDRPLLPRDFRQVVTQRLTINGEPFAQIRIELQPGKGRLDVKPMVYHPATPEMLAVMSQ